VQWRAALLSLYIEAKGEATVRDLKGETAGVKGDENGSLITHDLLHGLKEGKGGNRHGMQCGTRGKASMAG
jgi:hypothetical protein